MRSFEYIVSSLADIDGLSGVASFMFAVVCLLLLTYGVYLARMYASKLTFSRAYFLEDGLFDEYVGIDEKVLEDLISTWTAYGA